MQTGVFVLCNYFLTIEINSRDMFKMSFEFVSE